MKDKILKYKEKIYIQYYKIVTKIAYMIITKNRAKGCPALTAKEKKQIKDYWKRTYGKLPNLNEFRWFKKKNGYINPKIIPDLIWHTKIETKFNDMILQKAFQDKNYFETFLGKENVPNAVVRCINYQLLDDNYLKVQIQEAQRLLKQYDEVICKPSLESGGGKGIKFFKKQEINEELIYKLIKDYNGNFIVQEIIEQSEFLNNFNKNSVNTFRITSFLYNGNFKILSSFIRIGNKNSRVDNISSGGYFRKIYDGVLDKYYIKENLETGDLIKQKIEQEKTNEEQIPYWEEIVEKIRISHFRIPHFGIVNWDVTLNKENKPIIIEYNLLDSGAYFHQINNDPIFGDLTDEVLKKVGKNRKNVKN